MDPSRRKLMTATLAAVAAEGLASCASRDPEHRRSAGEFTDDAAITAKVKTAIATEAGARTAAAINVETYKGVVSLTGFVDDQDQANRAMQAAKKVQGVRSVKNDMRLKSG